jgi:hypothetical protein
VRRYPIAVPNLECTREGVIVDREKIGVAGIDSLEMAMKPPAHIASAAIPTVSVIIEKRTRREFDDYMEKLIEFKEEHGHVDGEGIICNTKVLLSVAHK